MFKSKFRNMNGGASAHQYGEYVSGGFDQKAVPGSNVIQYNDPKGYNGNMAGGKKGKKGNKSKKQMKDKMGGSLTTMAVPAVLLVANQMYKRKANRSAKSIGGTRKNRKSMKRN